jgi:predicted nucleic acid-binding protein
MFFIDSCVFIAFYNRSDGRHNDSKALLDDAFKGDLGAAYTSDYVLDETVTFIKNKTTDPKLISDYIDFVQNSGRLEILHIDRTIFASAKMCMEKYPSMPLSFTDWTIANLMEGERIEYLLSFDSGFDSLQTIVKFSKIKRIERL